jgi:uncharacterized protein
MTADSENPKLEVLRSYVRELGSALVCYSGGIDSTVVLAVATRELGSKAIGMTAVSPSLPTSERDGAARTARKLGAVHRFVDSHELTRPGYRNNGPDRCFHCKTELYEIAAAKCSEWQLDHVLNGTNRDDLGDFRPGLEAAKRAGVKSPLVDLGFSKLDVRSLARELGLEIWNKPAAACLSSRIPYGSEVTTERLSQIEGYEHALRELGFRQLRVRWHGDIARLELDSSELPRALEPEIRDAIVDAGRRHGFIYVTLDLAGYRQGSHNEALGRRALPLV